MQITIDTDRRTIEADGHCLDLYSKEGFELLSRHWVRVGFQQKYVYTFSWMGRPVIQLPEDMIRTQEVIYSVKPDVIVETGIAHGGSLIYYASLCKAQNKGRVIGVDIEIRPHNREAIEKHEMYPLITMHEGSSVDPEILSAVKEGIGPDDRVLVILDSNHTYEHVLAELKAYADLVSVGSYIVATDGIMFDLSDVPGGKPEWAANNPKRAAEEFVESDPRFVIEQPPRMFNESELDKNITHWPSAWCKRVS